MMLNVESKEELLLIQRVAERLNRVAPIALRVNPDIDPKTHPYISTGLHQHKFGIAISSAMDHYRLAASLSHLRIEESICTGVRRSCLSTLQGGSQKVLNLIKSWPMKTSNPLSRYGEG
jgi:diaminopimelate decarboxylase